MTVLRSLANLVRKVPGGSRWPYLIPGLVPLLFVGHAYEDAGGGVALVLGGFSLLCLAQAVWPTVLVWTLLFGLFFGYGVVVALSLKAGPSRSG